MARRVNYLNNKDILKEIHKSKTSFCSYLTPDIADYDIILHSAKEIPKNIKAGRIARADRLNKITLDAQVALGNKNKGSIPLLDQKKIPNTDIVFRVMTWDHVPEAPFVPKAVKVKKGKSIILPPDPDDEPVITEYDDVLPEIAPPGPIKYVKVNFPPFYHYKLDENKKPYVVGKSHWKGDLETGVFSKDHGKITNTLALMFIKLCERYATRSNWRGYTYNDEMKSQALLQLSQIGLQFDESKSDNPFAYYTAAITNSFTRVLNIEKRNQNIRDDILELNNLTPSYTRQNMNTGGHDHYDE